MKIQVLMENTTKRSDIVAEHGLSLYIEVNGKTILFDSGQSDKILENAKQMGVDLGKVDMFILSHGHYDHGGGLKAFLEVNKVAPIYLSQYAFMTHYNLTRQADIGLDPTLEGNPRLHFVKDFLDLGNGLTLLSCNDKEHPYPIKSYGLCTVENGEYVPDTFIHEQYLSILENGKHIVISGCSHKGILNIAEWFEADVLVGGFHLMKVDTAEDAGLQTLKETANILLKHKTKYYTCHCTGIEQYKILKNIMGDRISYLSAGESITI